MNDEFYDLHNYVGFFKINKQGDITTNKSKKLLKKLKTSDNYIEVCLCKNKYKKFFKIHLLVANQFLQNPHNYKYVEHIDKNKENNRLSNLKFVENLNNEIIVTFG